MNINLHIDRLILDGLPIEHRHGPLVKAAVEAELGRLLAAEGLAGGLMPGAVPSVSAREIRLAPAVEPSRLGRQVAHAVYKALGNSR